MVVPNEKNAPHEIVIVGGGFGGLYAAKALANAKVNVTLIDKRNFHLFQPLLYQVATGTLSPSDISAPLRSVFSKSKNTKVLLGEVTDINPKAQRVIFGDESIPYDTLILATGANHSYFGKDNWKEIAPGLKTVEDAIEMRRQIFSAFEAAEKESDPAKRRALLTFVIVGGGPTGVELSGAIAELAYQTLKEDFRNIDTTETKILLLQGGDRILPHIAPELSQVAIESLQKLGVVIHTQTRVTNIENDIVTFKQNGELTEIPSKTILWAAGVQGSALGKILAERTDVECDFSARVIVEPDLTIKDYKNIFVIGDLANFSHQNGKPLPGVAPVAKQQGEYVGKLIKRRLQGRTLPEFKYNDVGSLAMIGQNLAVVDLGFIKLTGFIAWVFWLVIHIYFLIEFDTKLVIVIQWAWNYITRNRRSRLITGKEAFLATQPVNNSGDSQPNKNKQPVNL
ncbi:MULTISPECIES: NAD(P)/FAD-dependent oxidoreductase [Nostocales]|jgi:NADH dehydrogenase|uniref:NADH:ubiquinone reductase (non-electrogenic) n=1 Tax=Aphanizomenon flos-aquae FACHB-1040 TaxID=2692887 RepID=A0ABR8C000_APHFL|nr:MULTISPECIES: NAD(P)/FAD-dependent oxidoreductase [Nostocales]MBO1068948.1 NAD(P)/FAD-dependent oxidoreductase [Dolichospermum sp. DEX189]MCX5982906.1 NAD(P)/FAD-dependent oxidoreductase [Nostocales cyanobacterium LacPavin_0920_SED1_MAG_38_18]QSV70130.1 MAG: NAD(P)/FAD-dependent oxidoreductase [Aphanizomenon flos-aquae KM1D3_PB]ALB42082.1 pyridine nucleotide-disulfide oxidoreductase [Anabaena sp. WA102]KHG41541.1 pyridine nucleotide-disulfide oxidoreductase [Aphanizomenon flos-aquae 2012/KM